MRTDGPCGPRPIRIVLVDDHPAVREGLALLLAPEGIIVCGEAAALAGAVEVANRERPDLALVDLSLGGEDGTTVVAELRALRIRSLVYSMHEDPRHVEAAFAAGAVGYVTKREINQVLVRAIREAAAGRRFVGPYAALALAERAAHPGAHVEVQELSDQEREVYRLLGDGEGTPDIAAALDISSRTVESYYARILIKLGLDGMRDLRRHAIAHRSRT